MVVSMCEEQCKGVCTWGAGWGQLKRCMTRACAHASLACGERSIVLQGTRTDRESTATVIPHRPPKPCTYTVVTLMLRKAGTSVNPLLEQETYVVSVSQLDTTPTSSAASSTITSVAGERNARLRCGAAGSRRNRKERISWWCWWYSYCGGGEGETGREGSQSLVGHDQVCVCETSTSQCHDSSQGVHPITHPFLPRTTCAPSSPPHHTIIFAQAPFLVQYLRRS